MLACVFLVRRASAGLLRDPLTLDQSHGGAMLLLHASHQNGMSNLLLDQEKKLLDLRLLGLRLIITGTLVSLED